MKKTKRTEKTIRELASHFDSDLQATLPITRLANGGIIYKQYLIKELPNKNWGLFNIANKDLIEQFFLKSCALMAAKEYSKTRIMQFYEIKRLDNQYWASYIDTVIFKNNIKNAKDFDRYVILLNKLEYSTERTSYFKEEISRMFKWSFV